MSSCSRGDATVDSNATANLCDLGYFWYDNHLTAEAMCYKGSSHNKADNCERHARVYNTIIATQFHDNNCNDSSGSIDDATVALCNKALAVNNNGNQPEIGITVGELLAFSPFVTPQLILFSEDTVANFDIAFIGERDDAFDLRCA